MIDENTPLAERQSCLNYSATPKQDAEAAKEEVPIDRVFVSIALLGMFFAAADDSFVLATHGEIATDFKQLALGPWIVSAYNLGFITTLPLYGKLSDAYGYKLVLLVAYLMFSFGCIISGTAPSIWVVIGGRFIAGVGASGMTDLVSLIINDLAPPRQVVMLRSYFGMAFPIGISSGTGLGGMLLDAVGWRWSFLVQVPFGLLCFFIAMWRLPAPNDSSKTQHEINNTGSRELNLFGVFSLGISVAALTILCHSIGDGIAITVPLVVAILSAVVYGWNEKFWTKVPLVSWDVVKHNGIWAIYAIQFFTSFAAFGLLANISEFFTRTINATASFSGATFTIVTVGSIVGSAVWGFMIRRTGNYKALALTSCTINIIGFGLLMVRWSEGPKLWELAYLAIHAIGHTGLITTLFVAISVAAPKDSGAGPITTYYLAQQIGMVVGVTATSVFTRNVFRSNLLESLAMEPNAQEIIENILRESRFAFTHLSDRLQVAVANSYMHAFAATPGLCVACMLLVIPALICMPQLSLD
ncbi:transporter [Penicillium angulare]|uniref:transporter n=1 Tax=Penicillium angulare TaxID=116970 RepID=UPI00254026FC|nr:transporter [Penicillium angulare]KAJ5263966.1 transporter [Penicillium angulare]